MLGRIQNGLFGAFANLYGGATLEQMTLKDKGPNGLPLLLHMTLPGQAKGVIDSHDV